VRAAEERRLLLAPASQFNSQTGRGVTALVQGRKVVLGNIKLIEELGIDSEQAGNRAEELRRAGQTTMFVAIDGKMAGLIGVADPRDQDRESSVPLKLFGIQFLTLRRFYREQPN
jgi:P-type Cu+ transporter